MSSITGGVRLGSSLNFLIVVFPYPSCKSGRRLASLSLSTMDGRDKIEVLTVESFDGKFSLAILGHTEVHFVLFFVVMSS